MLYSKYLVLRFSVAILYSPVRCLINAAMKTLEGTYFLQNVSFLRDMHVYAGMFRKKINTEYIKVIMNIYSLPRNRLH